MQRAAAEEEAKRPKRTFQMPGTGSAFSQMMRAQMGGAASAGPRKLDVLDKKNYREMGNTQAANAKDKVQAVNEKVKARNAGSARHNEGSVEDDFVPNWRTGNFTNPNPAASATNLAVPTPVQAAQPQPANKTKHRQNNSMRGGNNNGANNRTYEEQKPQRPKTVCYGAELIIREGDPRMFYPRINKQ